MSSNSSPQLAKRASQSSATKRASTAASAPRPPLTSSSRAIIAGHAALSGTHRITLGPYTVLNPYARIYSIAAPVTIGEGCVLWEKASVGILAAAVKEEGEGQIEKVEQEKQWGTTLGKNVVVESMAVVEAREIGDGTVIESAAKVGLGCIVGKFCTITAGTVVPPFTTLPDFTIVFGAAQRRTDGTLKKREDVLNLRVQAHEKLLESLSMLIPNTLAKWQ